MRDERISHRQPQTNTDFRRMNLAEAKSTSSSHVCPCLSVSVRGQFQASVLSVFSVVSFDRRSRHFTQCRMFLNCAHDRSVAAIPLLYVPFLKYQSRAVLLYVPDTTSFPLNHTRCSPVGGLNELLM